MLARLTAAVLAGLLGCATGQVHVPQADVARRLDELRARGRIRAVATNDTRVRIALTRMATIDQNVIDQSPRRAPVSELIAGCVLPVDSQRDGYRLELEGPPCLLANAQFLTLGDEPREPKSRRLGGHVLLWVVIVGVSLVAGLVTLRFCIAGDDHC